MKFYPEGGIQKDLPNSQARQLYMEVGIGYALSGLQGEKAPRKWNWHGRNSMPCLRYVVDQATVRPAAIHGWSAAVY